MFKPSPSRDRLSAAINDLRTVTPDPVHDIALRGEGTYVRLIATGEIVVGGNLRVIAVANSAKDLATAVSGYVAGVRSTTPPSAGKSDRSGG